MERVIVKHHHIVERRPVNVAAQRALDAEPRVRLVHEGGHVRALEVVCACGERITVELTYPEDAAGR